ncbi:MAG: hypothetical protein VX324_02125, partial [Pseudomonadota bacterium]|nr:hypothetical protein [Pseudomonadota bacterium]
DTEKLEAIRHQARREAAAKAHSEQAAKRSSQERQRTRGKGRISWGELVTVPVFIAVVLGLWAIYSQPEESSSNQNQVYEDLIAAEEKAVAFAGLAHLQQQGWNTSEISKIKAEPLGSVGHFKILFTYQGKTYQLAAETACDPGIFDLKAKQDPACYRWH